MDKQKLNLSIMNYFKSLKKFHLAKSKNFSINQNIDLSKVGFIKTFGKGEELWSRRKKFKN